MQFLEGPLAVIQCFVWMCVMFINITYLMQSQDDVMHIEVLFMNLLLLYRCCVISAKYGSMPPKRFECYETRLLETHELVRDMFLVKWRV